MCCWPGFQGPPLSHPPPPERLHPAGAQRLAWTSSVTRVRSPCAQSRGPGAALLVCFQLPPAFPLRGSTAHSFPFFFLFKKRGTQVGSKGPTAVLVLSRWGVAVGKMGTRGEASKRTCYSQQRGWRGSPSPLPQAGLTELNTEPFGQPDDRCCSRDDWTVFHTSSWGSCLSPPPVPLPKVKLEPFRGSRGPPTPFVCRYGIRQQGALQDWMDGNRPAQLPARFVERSKVLPRKSACPGACSQLGEWPGGRDQLFPLSLPSTLKPCQLPRWGW